MSTFTVPVVDRSKITGIATLGLGDLDLTAEAFANLAIGTLGIHGITIEGSAFRCIAYDSAKQLDPSEKVGDLPGSETAIVVVEQETFDKLAEIAGTDPSKAFVEVVRPMVEDWRRSGIAAGVAEEESTLDMLLKVFKLEPGIPLIGAKVDIGEVIRRLQGWFKR